MLDRLFPPRKGDAAAESDELPVVRQKRENLKTDVYPAMRPSPRPSRPSGAVTRVDLRVHTDGTLCDAQPAGPSPADLEAFDAEVAELREAFAHGALEWHILREQLRHARSGERREFYRMLNAQQLGRSRSAPILPASVQLERLLALKLFMGTATTIPAFEAHRGYNYPEGVLLIPRFHNGRFTSDDATRECAHDGYLLALNRALRLLEDAFPGSTEDFPCPLVKVHVKINAQTFDNVVMGSWGTFGDIKALPVQLGRRHIGSSFLRTLHCALHPEEWGLDLLTAVFYLLTHADELQRVLQAEAPCSFSCDGMALRSMVNGPFDRVPVVRFQSRAVRLVLAPLSATSIDRGSATGFNANILTRFSR